MTKADRVQELFERHVEHHVFHAARLRPEDLCAECPGLIEPLRELIRQYDLVNEALTMSASAQARPPAQTDDALPNFPGFRTVERLGSGGGGEIYKLEDLELGRLVAAKVIRADNPLHATLDDFLREARSLALFEDPRVVRLLEFRSQADPPVLLMEFVDGFELSHIGRSLEYAQRARVMAEIAEAIHHAHTLGIQHRDLKPANIILDAQLRPKILDFGLSEGDPRRGHGRGTLAYMAPEQLDPDRPIDARSDVYALGVILYELLCGALPFTAASQAELIAAIEAGEPQMPVEIEPAVPEALQAIALRAMEKDPANRYASAREMVLELRRSLEIRPVLARPSLYHSALNRRLRPHLEHIREWLRIKLIYPHEAERLDKVYRSLEAREDDWIVESRTLSLSQIALYLGAFLLFCGSLLYFVAYQSEAIAGLVEPSLALVLPFVGLNVAAYLLYRRERQAAAVAFYLGAVVLLPLFLLILFEEAGLWPVAPENERELLGAGFASNRQLQAAACVACAWSGWLALHTRTVALSTCFTFLALVFNLAVLADLDLRSWVETGSYDVLAVHLVPFFVVTAALGRLVEARRRPWFARPLYLAGVAMFVAILELLALNGKAFEHLGLSMTAFHTPEVSDPVLLDTVTAMTLNGLLIYLAAWLLDRRGSALMKGSAALLFFISPFATLEPLAYLNQVGEYPRRFDWLYLGLALAITFASHFRQRKSFYYAGLINTGVAVWLITDHYEWFDRPVWAVVVGGIGLVVLVVGSGLDTLERRRRAT